MAVAYGLLLSLGYMLGPAEASRHFISVYQGVGVDANLRELPNQALSRDLRPESSYMTAVGYYHPLETPGLLQSVLDWLHLGSTTTGMEFFAAKHYGLQYNWELGFAYLLRFRGWRVGMFHMRPGFGVGLSYALGEPSYEDGPRDDPQRRYRLQNYNAYELEWMYRNDPHTSVALRIHHRSGVYGLIAPPHVGSNFISMGIRRAF